MYCCIKKTILKLLSIFVCVFLCDFSIGLAFDVKIKGDCVFSIGPACRPSQWLRKTKKRFQSCPLDWMMKYSLDTALHCFGNKFEDFFEETEATGEYIGNCRVVKDKRNNIVSMHHFNKNFSLNDAKKEVRDMMIRRGKEVDKIFKKSNSIVLICNRQKDSNDDLKSFLKGFSKLYPERDITLINVRSNNSDNPVSKVIYSGNAVERKKSANNKTHVNSKSKNNGKRKNNSKKLCLIEYQFRDISPDTRKYPEWEGNPYGWQKVMDDIELTDKFFNKNMDFKKVEF